MKTFINNIKALAIFTISAISGPMLKSQCTVPVITTIGNNGPLCEGGTLLLNAAGTVGGVSSSFVRMAGIGGNYGYREFNVVFSSGDRAGSIARLTNAQFNAIFASASGNTAKAQAIKAQYDVLLFTWASDQNTALNWGLIEAYLNEGGSVFWEDDSNIGRLYDGTGNSVNGQAFGGSSGCGYTIVAPPPFPTLIANGINGCFTNHHLRINAMPSWMQTYIKSGTNNMAVAGIYPNGNHGRLIVQGPDQDYHAKRGSSNSTEQNQYKILLNQLDFLVANQAGFTWSGPNGFTSNDASPVITNVTSANAGTYTATLTNITGGGCSTSSTTTVVINTAPTISGTADISQNTDADVCGANVNYSPTISGGTVTHSFSGATTGSGSGTGSGAFFNRGETVVTISSANNCGASTAVFTVTVIDAEAPVSPSIADVTGECDATVTMAPVATDACDGSITGTTTDPLTYNTQGTHTITWTFTDGSGNSSTATQNVVIDDVTAPAAPTLTDATGECGVAVSAPTAEDACAGTITGTTSDPTSYTTQGTYTVTWTFDDGNGNTSNATQTVIVDDVTAPVAPTLSDATGECSVTLTAPTAEDACAGTIAGTTSDPTSFTVQGSYTVTWSFNDGNGNTSTATQNVIVKDATAPTALCKNINLTLSSGAGSISASDINNGSYDNCSIASWTLSKSSFNCSNNGGNTVTLTITDPAGNSSSCTANVAISVISAADAGMDRVVYYGAPSAYSCAALTGTGTGGSGYTYSWTNGATTQTTTVCPTATTTYTVTITDNQGCSQSDAVKVCSFDVRCSAGKSGKMDKVLVCHKTGSTKNPTEQICIAASAVADHLNNHNDYLGTCGSTYTCGGSAPAPADVTDVNGYALGSHATLNAFPNPFNTNTNILFSVPAEQRVTIKVYDMAGKELMTAFDDVAPANLGMVISLNPEKLGYGTFILKMTTASGENLNNKLFRTR
ncbi:MAG: T9SS type A sorting domain-containing protein [Bacteroidetes bacterium]|nr:T9SS type A sorting domain-containing protein [Bacteroidota bacterium]